MKRFLTVLAAFIMFNTQVSCNDDQTSFEKVFDVIGSQQVFLSSFDQLMQQLNGLCTKSSRATKVQYKYGNIECTKDVGADSFSISGGNYIGFIQTSFVGADKCSYAKKNIN
ncbi:hypothetical protein [Sulfurirhabdus autotrophica]|uniref:Uncharacterized protein n=1 Tax=Sulfurirhabdus autotrophica TaxID=1706046 RepID=A0A4R3Y6A1_9PROT|nr:hypothetical protein [Sulfurirhabdus autotrophica]TCV87337.1 hypothetical protein EDC63_1052 [Sulfurirhabdus autotrophica]